jgi:hypothetical protein
MGSPLPPVLPPHISIAIEIDQAKQPLIKHEKRETSPTITKAEVHAFSALSLRPKDVLVEQNDNGNVLKNKATSTVNTSTSVLSSSLLASISGGDSFIEASLPVPILGILLLRLLHFYGFEFDPTQHGISAMFDGIFPHSPPEQLRELLRTKPSFSATGLLSSLRIGLDPLILPDPLDVDSNVGRNAYRFPQVQAEFRNAYNRLFEIAYNEVKQNHVQGIWKKNSFSTQNSSVSGIHSTNSSSSTVSAFPLLGIILPCLNGL